MNVTVTDKPWWTEPQVDFFGLDSADRYVYRYRSACRGIQELRTRRLRMSSFKELNDPKEFADWHFDLFSRDSRGSFDKTIEREIDASATIFAKSHAKVLCATLDDESAVGRGVNNIWGRGFSRPRMWQQYGDNYQGVCMIFDRAALQRAVEASVPAGSMLSTGRVNYSNTPRVFILALDYHPFMIDYDRVCAIGLQRAVREHALKHHQRLFFEKALDWQSETEYRWLIWDNTHAEHFFDFAEALKGMVAGPNFDMTRWEELQNLCAVDKVLVSQITWRNGSPDMVFRFPAAATLRTS